MTRVRLENLVQPTDLAVAPTIVVADFQDARMFRPKFTHFFI